MAFENGFSTEDLVSVAQDKWNSFVESRKHIPCENSGFQSADLLGVVTSLPRATENPLNEPLVVVSVTLPDGIELGARSSRKRQFEFAQKIIRAFAETPPCPLNGSVAHGLFAFSDEAGNFRLSLVTSQYDRQAKLAFNSFRRQSFFVEAGKKNRTFRKYFLDCADCATLADVREAFSVEALTKEFYTEIEKWFLWARKEVTFPCPVDSRMNVEEHNSTQTLRLITRLIFIWFLKQKKLVPSELFDVNKINELLKFSDKTNSTYYKAILQNLFFATFNTPLDKRAWVERQAGKQEYFRYKRFFKNDQKFEYLVNICGRVPFVNGGLFENLDGKLENGSPDEKRRLDCFSNRLDNEKRLVVPDELFLEERDVRIEVPRKNGMKEETTTGILTTLARYDFTITENSPSDEDVSLDPELLGRVFENLLAYVNPETSEQARKATGSFYTPREIVNYMVDEALKAYLGDISRMSPQDIAARLKAVRVLDPACGSGAFPMGILTRIIELLEEKGALDSDDADAVYQTKLDLIKNCIYGVDIQNIAVQISKLRFFISLLCEQKTNDNPADNYGVSVLPNLETKFVAANSLIAKKKREAQGDLFEDPEIEKTQKLLDDLRARHFGAQTPEEKQRIRKADEKERLKLAKLLEANGIFAPADAKQIALWNPYDPNVTASFFDSATMFGLKGGFDIVIGNPPYVVVESNDPLKEYYEQHYKCARGGKKNLYRLFFERSLGELKKDGVLSFITPNTFLAGTAGKSLREMFFEKVSILQLLEYSEKDRVFESAAQAVVVSLMRNTIASSAQTIIMKTERQGFLVAKQEDLRGQDSLVPNDAVMMRVYRCKTRLSDFLFGKQGEINVSTKKSEYSEQTRKGALPMWRGEHIGRYVNVGTPSEYCNISATTRQDYKYNRILTQQVSNQSQKYRTKCCIVGQNVLCGHSTNYLWNPKFSIEDLKFYLGVLNSKLIDYSFSFSNPTNNIPIGKLMELPMPKVSVTDQKSIIDLVEKILAIKSGAAGLPRTASGARNDVGVADTSELERKIDALVYKLYGLTEEEIAIVEASGLPRTASGARNDEEGGRGKGCKSGAFGERALPKRGKPAGYRPDMDGEDE